jgi:hypothetical protein
MWFGAVTFFVITECLILLPEHERLSGLSRVRLWSLPLMIAMPLIQGAGLARAIGKNPHGKECGDLTTQVLLGIATLEGLVYAILCGTATFIQ